VTGGGRIPIDPSLPGYDPTPAGFRYDLATDSAVVLPLVVAAAAPVNSGFPAPLTAYPFFAYFAPGAHLEPPSLFGVALTVAATLRAHCRQEAALKWYELFFRPLEQDDTWAQCPPSDIPTTPAETVGDAAIPEGRSPVHVLTTTRAGFGIDEPCCPSEPVSDDVARNRAVLLHYLETLLEWGDALMCRNSPESFQQATVIFQTLARVLGPQPATIAARNGGADGMTIAGFEPAPAPLNPRLLALYRRTADRLALLHRCVDAPRLRDGRPNVDMPYWGDSALGDGWQPAAHTCGEEDDWCLASCTPYRFVFLVQKALELAGQVRGLGAALLAAYEKGDAEYLASLRATQERQLLELGLEVRQNQWREADWQVQALQKTKEGAQTRKRYYEALIAHGLNAGETGYEAQTGVSMASRTAGNVSEAVAQIMQIIPDFFVGFPCTFTWTPVGTKLSGVFSAIARIMNVVAEIASSNAGLDLTHGGWDRREDEWRFQVEVIGIEIEQIERQILAGERRRDIALRELNNHQQQIEHAVDVQDFLRDKFTSHELYLFLQKETAALHHQCVRTGEPRRPAGPAGLQLRAGDHRAQVPTGRRLGQPPRGPAGGRAAGAGPPADGEGLPRRQLPGVRADQARLAAAQLPDGLPAAPDDGSLRDRASRVDVRPGLPRPLHAADQERDLDPALRRRPVHRRPLPSHPPEPCHEAVPRVGRPAVEVLRRGPFESLRARR
jgi:hypothetical protein